MRLPSSAMFVVLLALVGCGGEESTFTEDYNRAVKPLTLLGKDIGTQPEAFERLARSTERTHRELSRLEAPEDARDEFDALLTRLDGVTRNLSAMARAERSKDVVKQRRAAKRLVRSGNAFERAETALKRAVEG
jgi:hypothetical protein